MWDDVLGGLNRLMGRRVDRDGRAPALETMPLLSQEAASFGMDRRDRRLGLPQEILDRSLAQKVLEGWLQNRHQVLVPLTLRLNQLRADDVELLMRFTAASLLVASEADTDARHVITRWLRTIGAVDEALVVFERAMHAPSALSALLDGVRARHLEAYAYAVASMASDLRTAPGRLYADFVAARLALPAEAVRSINRRYRR